MPSALSYPYQEIQARRDRGQAWSEIAADLAADPDNLRKAYSKWLSRSGLADAPSVPSTFDEAIESIRQGGAILRGEAEPSRATVVERPAATAEKWPYPVRPVRFDLPRWEPPRLHYPTSDLFRVVHIPDIHVPFHDGAALGVVYAYLAANHVDGVVLHGDLVDCYTISSFDRDRHHRVSMQEEVDVSAAVLARITQLTPFAQWRQYFEGNHENRLTRILNKMASDRSSAEILDLRLVKEALSWPVLLGLDELGWSYHTQRGLLFNRLITKHGDIVRKHAAYTARAELDKYHCSGMSGHTHRIGNITQSDHNGVHGWWEIGCLCDLDPSYVSDPNWQHGFAISEWDLSQPTRPQYQVTQVHIHNGRAIIGGRVYEALTLTDPEKI